MCYRPNLQHIKNVISHWSGGEGKLSNEGLGPGVLRRTENHLFPVHRAHPYCSALVKTHTVISPCLFAGLFNVASVSDLMCEFTDVFALVLGLSTAQWSRCQLGCPGSQNFHVFQLVATGAYYPKLEFEKHKNQHFSWLLSSEHVKRNIFFGYPGKKNWPFEIGLSLLDHRQLLVDSKRVVHSSHLLMQWA